MIYSYYYIKQYRLIFYVYVTIFQTCNGLKSGPLGAGEMAQH